MITKERLEELIKEKATIYFRTFDCVREIAYNAIPSFWKKHWENYYGNWMFETEEDAKFDLRYKRIPKTEYLDLPTWEEFCNEDKIVTFTAYPYNYHLLKVGNYIRLKSFYKRDGMDIFIKSLTKENYLEACEICRKLWLGEQV